MPFSVNGSAATGWPSRRRSIDRVAAAPLAGERERLLLADLHVDLADVGAELLARKEAAGQQLPGLVGATRLDQRRAPA